MDGKGRLEGKAIRMTAWASARSSRKELQKPVRNVVHDALAQHFEVLCDVLAGPNFSNEEFEQVKGDGFVSWKK